MSESDQFRRARKQHIRESGQAGMEATLRKGRQMDEEHNVPAMPRERRPAAEILREVRSVAATVRFPETEECVIEDVPMPMEEEQVKEEKKENTTLNELEQLKAAIARLERLEKENHT